MDKEDDGQNWADPGALCGGRSRPGDDNDNDNGEGEEDTQGGEKGSGKVKGTKHGTRKGKATEDGKGNVKGKGKGNGKVRGIVQQTPGGGDISRAVALQLEKEMSEADQDTEG